MSVRASHVTLAKCAPPGSPSGHGFGPLRGWDPPRAVLSGSKLIAPSFPWFDWIRHLFCSPGLGYRVSVQGLRAPRLVEGMQATLGMNIMLRMRADALK